MQQRREKQYPFLAHERGRKRGIRHSEVARRGLRPVALALTILFLLRSFLRRRRRPGPVILASVRARAPPPLRRPATAPPVVPVLVPVIPIPLPVAIALTITVIPTVAVVVPVTIATTAWAPRTVTVPTGRRRPTIVTPNRRRRILGPLYSCRHQLNGM